MTRPFGTGYDTGRLEQAVNQGKESTLLRPEWDKLSGALRPGWMPHSFQMEESWIGYPKGAQLIDALMVNPYMSVARAQRLLKVSNPTARHVVARLEKLKLLNEITGREWGRLYLARPILRIIEKTRGRDAESEG